VAQGKARDDHQVLSPALGGELGRSSAAVPGSGGLTAIRAALKARPLWQLAVVGLAALLFALALLLPRGVLDERSAAVALPPSGPTSEAAVPPIGLLAGTDRPTQSTLASDNGFGGMLLDVGSKLLLTLALLYATLYLVRKYSNRLSGRGPNSNLAVVETLRLGQSGALHLVRVGDRHLLIGATSQQITLLGEAEKPREDGTESLVGAPIESAFLDQLRALGGMNRPPTGAP
jgi:flagellar protein FliO/FliZ